MSKTILRTILCLAAAFFATPTLAETLLAEFSWSNPDPVTLPAGYYLGLGQPLLQWPIQVTSYPTSVDADTAQLDLINQSTTKVSTTIRVDNGNQTCNCPFETGLGWVLGGEDGIWATGAGNDLGWHAETYVPQLGPNFTGYDITKFTRLITPAAQTFFVYGVVVPEPATAWLILLGMSPILFRRQR